MKDENSILRIKRYKKGFVVETQKSKWTLFGIKKYWTHFISYSGLSEQPLYYSTFNMAMEEMLEEVRCEVLDTTTTII